MKRAEILFRQIETEILSGKFGLCGDRFISVRELAKRYTCSLHCALDVVDLLLDSRIIRKHGKHCYITPGRCPPDSAYGRILFDSQRALFGVLIRDNSNPFFGSLINHLRDILYRNGMDLIIAGSGNDPDKEKQIMDMFIDLKCRGVFSCVTLLRQQQKLFSRYPLPIVTLAEDSGISTIDSILVDNHAAGIQVAKHLLECGSKSHAYITLDDYVESDLRLQGFRSHLERKQHSLPPENIGIVSATDEAVRARQLKQFLHNLLDQAVEAEQQLPIGIFCVHDLLAADAMRIVKHYSSKRKRKLLIPADVMIVGFDDLPISSQLSIPMTTISYQYSAISRKAFDVMIDCLQNPGHAPGRHEVQSLLIIRESTQKTQSRD